MTGLVSLALRLLAVGGKFAVMLVLGRFADVHEVGAFALFFGAINIGLFAIGFDFHLFAIREMLARRTQAARTRIVLGQAVLDLSIYTAVLLIGFATALIWGSTAWGLPILWFVSILVVDHLAQEISRQFLVAKRPFASNMIYAVKTGLWGWIGGGLVFLRWIPAKVEAFYALWLCADLMAIAIGTVGLARILELKRIALPKHYFQWTVRGWRVSRYYYATSMSSMGIAYLDRFIIGGQISVAAAGLYAFWQSITSLIPVVVYALVGMHYLPRLVEAFTQGRVAEFRRHARSFFKRSLLIVLGSAASLLAFAQFVPLVIGKAEFSVNYSLIMLLGGAAGANAMWQVPYQVLYSAGEDKYLALVLCSLTAATLALDVLAIPAIGMIGAALVTLMINVSIFAVLSHRARRHHAPIPRYDNSLAVN